MTTQADTITTRSGDNLRLNVTAQETDGSVIDLTNASLKFGLSKTPTGDVVVSKSTSTGGVSVTDALAGEFTILIEPADTDPLSGMFYYEVELVDNVGVVSTILVGEMMVKTDML